MRLTALLVPFSVLIGITALPARAQEPAPPAASNSATLLPDLWRKEQGGRVLVVVAPGVEDAGTVYARMRQWQKEPPEKAKNAPRDVADWLQANNAVVRSFGAVSVVADRTAFRTATKLAPPDLFDSGNAWQNKRTALNQLVGTLSEAQWRQIASPQGLGLGSLSGDQVRLWEIAVPNPFVVDRVTDKYSRQEPPKENTRTLSDSERRQVRLRIKLVGAVYATTAKTGAPNPIVFDKNRNERGQEKTAFLNLRETGRYQQPQQKQEAGVFAYGQYLTQFEPNRPKTLPEAFAQKLSAAPVAIAPAGDKPLTLGNLLDTINTATGLKINAAASLRAREVTVASSGSVAASDLLRGLLFATRSTVRVLPPVLPGEAELYVIAPEREPAGRIVGRITDWYQMARSRDWENRDEAIAAINPVPFFRFDADDPAALSPAQYDKYMKLVEERIQKGQSASNVRMKVALSGLPPATQKEVNAQAKYLADLSNPAKGYDFRVQLDSLSVDCGTWLSYVVPGSGELSGEIDNDPAGDLANWLPHPYLPAKETMSGRVLAIAPDDTAQARALVAAGRKAGAKEIWVQGAPEIVSASVAAAGGTPVRAIASVLRVAEDTPLELPRDENLYGTRSRDWLVPDNPEVIAYAATRVRTMASVLGIAGVVLRDGLPLGYRGATEEDADNMDNTGDMPTYNRAKSGDAVGYSLAHRRAYLSEKGQDPADIVDNVPVDIGWQEDAKAMRSWQAWRHEQTRPLWTALRAAAGKNPVLFEGESTFWERGNSGYARLALFVPWDAKLPEPPMASAFRNTIAQYPRLDSKMRTLVRAVGNPAMRTSTAELLRLLKLADKPDETVWDLTDKRAPGNAERIRALLKTVADTP